MKKRCLNNTVKALISVTSLAVAISQAWSQSSQSAAASNQAALPSRLLDSAGLPVQSGSGAYWGEPLANSNSAPLAGAKVVAPSKLQEAVQMAITTSPDVLFAYRNLESVVRDKQAAAGRYLPGIDFNSSVGRENRNDPIPSANNVYKRFSRETNSIVLRQLIFDGGNTLNDVARLDFNVRGKIFELHAAASSSALETTRAYVDLIRYRTLVSLAEDNYVAHKLIFEQLKLKATAGVGKKSDVEQAQSRFALAEYNLNVEGSNLHDIEARFQRHTGMLPPADLDPSLPVAKDVPLTSQDALKSSQMTNPGLLASVMDIKGQEAAARVRVSSALPRVEFRARHDWGTNINGYLGAHRNDVVEVVTTWNLLNGGTDFNLHRKELELIQSAQKRRDLTCRNIRLELQIAYNDIRKLKEQMNYLDARQISIERARDAYRQQFEIGQRSLVDLLNSENEVFEAKRLYTNISSDLTIAYARAHFQLGSLLKVLNVQRYAYDEMPLPEVDGAHVNDLAVSCEAESPTPYRANKQELDARAGEMLNPAKLQAPQTQNLNQDFKTMVDESRGAPKTGQSK